MYDTTRDRGADEARLVGLLDQAAGLLRETATIPLGAGVRDGALTGVIQRLEALGRMCHGQKLAAIAEVARREAYRGAGAASTEDLLTRTLGLGYGEAKAQTELAAGLEAVPQTATALREGRIGVSQAAVTVKKAEEVKDREGGDELVAQLDEVAATEGQRLDRRRLGQQLDEVMHRQGVDVLAERERNAHRRRGVWFGHRDGLPTIEARMTVEGYAFVKTALDSLSRPDGAGDPRTPAHRAHDALVTLAERYLSDGSLPQVAGLAARVLLVTNPDALHGAEGAEPSLLDGVGPVSNDLARQLCCDADVTHVVTDRNGAVLDIGRTSRVPTTAQRLAVIARDKVCVGCAAPVSRCQIHHIRWWTRDKGPTDETNLTLVCWTCHHHIHHAGWRVWREGNRYRAGPPQHHSLEHHSLEHHSHVGNSLVDNSIVTPIGAAQRPTRDERQRKREPRQLTHTS